MMQKFRKLSLESQLFFSFMAVSVCLLLLSLSITLSSTITRQRQEIDKNISALAAYVASMDSVVSMLENGYPDGSANEALDSLSENFPDLNVIAIYNTTGLRFYHTNRKETGETFVGGEEEAILKGSQPYITIGYGTNGSQRRAFHSIRNSDGAIIGFVIASVFNTYISEQIHEVFPTYLLAAMVMLLVSILLSHGLVSLLRDSLMGHHPTELLDLYLRQDTVLNALEEGANGFHRFRGLRKIRRQKISFMSCLKNRRIRLLSPRTMGLPDRNGLNLLWKDALSGISSRNPRQTGSSRPAHRPTTVPAPVRTEDFWSVRFRQTPRRSIR